MKKFPLENRARIIFAMSFGDITGGLSYLDSNYATQDKISADTIARYMLFSKYQILYMEAGLFASYGVDKQSLNELNNDVKLLQFGGSFSVDI